MPARILIVEDDAASRELLRYLLFTAGYDALVAADGGIGARMAIEANPDLVLCDLQMPLMDGYAVLKHLRASPQWRKVPVIAVTAFSMPGDRETALAVGFDGYFAKPITPETFVRDVESFLAPELVSPSPPGKI
ncbi:MAG: response regulator [Casimicrobiaceae bacterium]